MTGGPWSGWFKARASNPNGECVEIRFSATRVQVRDSARPDGAVLEFSREAWLSATRRLGRREPRPAGRRAPRRAARAAAVAVPAAVTAALAWQSARARRLPGAAAGLLCLAAAAGGALAYVTAVERDQAVTVLAAVAGADDAPPPEGIRGQVRPGRGSRPGPRVRLPVRRPGR